VKQLQIRDQGADDSCSTRLIPMMREYTVFNVDQCENLPDGISTGKPMRVRNPDTRDELADAFLHSPAGADIREGHGEAYYVPSRDFISMPAFAGFKGADHFYNVAFHEFGHHHFETIGEIMITHGDTISGELTRPRLPRCRPDRARPTLRTRSCRKEFRWREP